MFCGQRAKREPWRPGHLPQVIQGDHSCHSYTLYLKKLGRDLSKKKKKLLLRGKAVSTVLFTGISCLMLRCTAVSIHWSREHCQLDNRLAGSALEIWHQRQVPRKLRITVNICYMMKCHHVTKLDHIIRKQLWIPMECSNHLISHSKHSFLFWPSPVPSP